MRSLAALATVLALVIGIGAFASTRSQPTARPEEPPHVRLAVLVVFDQIRGDYPARWKHLFGPGGFLRLTSEGAWFTDCHYPYGVTTTGPGHASILTGTCPDRHGIVNNNWYERGKDTYCAADARYLIEPPVEPRRDPKTNAQLKPPAGGTPERLLSETVADVLKRTHGDRAKVFGLSLKDRSAILTTGRKPDGAFWFDGRIVTSSYYTRHQRRKRPDWVSIFNGPNIADRWFGKTWDRLRGDVDYERNSGPDDAPGEGTGVKQGRTFPHPMTGGLAAAGKEYYDAFANSPYGNELLLKLAQQCIIAEDLGRDDVPDLLVVSFSSNDLIGHSWGPDSQEVLDVTLRTDALLSELLRFLDARAGRGGYVLALTADHGICPLPEVSRQKGRKADRVSRPALQRQAESYLRDRFGHPASQSKANWIESVSLPWMSLNPNLVQATGLQREEVAESLADFLRLQPAIARAFTRRELAAGATPRDEVQRRMMRSYHPDRCGDVGIVLQPLYIPSDRKDAEGGSGTTHGSPYDYDTHVPLIVLGPNIPGGIRREPVTPQATAAVFSRMLGLNPPADAEFPVPETLFAR